ncbi:MAG: RluA family pseudouridine synthase [Christensenellales bacterium]|jgi:23S rRNA pseudouridine1911/1915/1917 synthase
MDDGIIIYENIKIIYEDNHILVVVKPQNIPTQGDSSGDKDILTYLKEYIKEKYDKKGEVFLGIVHRLDRPTGGVMVFAKTSKAAERLFYSMKEGDFEKKYLAVVHGAPKEKQNKLVHYLIKNERRNIVQVAPMTSESAKRAELDYKVLNEKEDLSLVMIKLITGRSHQARVQMSTIGAPIVGDVKYGKKIIKSNLALWATEIKFTHPTLKEKMTFRVYPPEDEYPWNLFDLDIYLKININY